MNPNLHSMVRDAFSLSTWLLLGACAQSLLLLLLPSSYRPWGTAPAAALLAFRLVRVAMMTAGLAHDEAQEEVRPGRWTARIPAEGAPGLRGEVKKDAGVTVFVLGTRSNHPLGVLAPGFKEVGAAFREMWESVEGEDGPKDGLLGKSASMLSLDRHTNNEIVTISYWKSREHLARFAQAPPHMKAWRWWNKAIKVNSHLSIMHEVYDVPAGCWENIYVNNHTMGMGRTRHVIDDGEKSGFERHVVGPLVELKDGRGPTMMARMNMQ